MKKIILSSTILLVFLSACNNQADTSNEEVKTESIDETATVNNSNSAGGNAVSNNQIELSGAQEVPANNSSGSGTADVSYNKDSKMLTYKVNYTGLTSAPSMAHIHGTAPKGVNAGVKKDLTSLLVKSSAGSFSDSVMVDGNAIKEDSLLAGFYYFNIHTPKFPAGEIRGQIDIKAN